MDSKAIRDELYEQFARIGRAVSHPKRLHLLHLLCQEEKTVEVLSTESEQSMASTSAHLQVLKSASLVKSRKKGRYVYYGVINDAVQEFWLSLQNVGQSQLAEVREVIHEYFSDRESMAVLEKDELMNRLEEGDLILSDLRPEGEYASGHIPGALSLPFSDLDEHLKNLPKDKDIFAYCRGSYCVTALEGVEELRSKGFHAYRLDGGVAEWRKLGLNLEKKKEEEG